MTHRHNGKIVWSGTKADVFNWDNAMLKRYNPFQPRAHNWFNFGNLHQARPDQQANAIFDEQLVDDLIESGTYD